MPFLRRILPAMAGLLILAPSARSEPETHVAPTSNPSFTEMPVSIPLWPNGAPGSEGQRALEQSHWESYKTSDGLPTWYAVVSDINQPSITPFLPSAQSRTGIAVVVCPGGGHRFLALEHEGYSVGKWLSEHGIAAFVLKYRLARTPNSPYQVEIHSLMDAQRAIRLVRSRAAEWDIDPKRVGIMGFSAGGEVAYLAATRFETPVKGSSDAVDVQDCRPAFQALLYPGLPKEPAGIGPRTPPAFLCGASDDSLKLTPPMVRLYLSLEDAGIPSELHVYATGGHGFGIRADGRAVYSWMPLFARWAASVGR